jgi:hypothetical protein
MNIAQLKKLGELIAHQNDFARANVASTLANNDSDFAQEKACRASEAFEKANADEAAAVRDLHRAVFQQTEAFEEVEYYADQAAQDSAINTKKALEAANKADAEVLRARAKVKEMTHRAIEAKNLKKLCFEEAEITLSAARQKAMMAFDKIQLWSALP